MLLLPRLSATTAEGKAKREEFSVDCEAVVRDFAASFVCGAAFH